MDAIDAVANFFMNPNVQKMIGQRMHPYGGNGPNDPVLGGWPPAYGYGYGYPPTEFVPPVCPMYPPYPPPGIITPSPTKPNTPAPSNTSVPLSTSNGSFLGGVGTGAANLATELGQGTSNLLTDLGAGSSQIINKSVDTAGNIVEQSIDAAGNVVNRTFDTAGNLINTTGGLIAGAGLEAGLIIGGTETNVRQLLEEAGSGAVGLVTGSGSGTGATGTAAGGVATYDSQQQYSQQVGYAQGGYQTGYPQSQYANVTNYFGALPQMPPSNFVPMTNDFSKFGK